MAGIEKGECYLLYDTQIRDSARRVVSHWQAIRRPLSEARHAAGPCSVVRQPVGLQEWPEAKASGRGTNMCWLHGRRHTLVSTGLAKFSRAQ